MSIKIRLTFRQLFWLTAGILLLLIFLLNVLIGIQGQRIRYGTIDTVAATQDRNQKISLSLSQPLSSVSNTQVSITPKASFAVLAEGDSVVVQLKERLQYDTHYTVKLSKLRDRNGKESDKELSYSFSTPPPSFYYLKRNYGSASNENFYENKQADEIRVDNMKGQNEVVFNSPRIQEYCALNNRLIVTTVADDEQNHVYSVDLATLKHTELPLPQPEGGAVEQLRCSAKKDTYGFVFTTKGYFESDERRDKYNSILFISQAGSNKNKVINGIDKKPLRVSEWDFAPDGTSILAATYNSGVLLVDSLGLHNTLPLGNFFDIGNFNFDGQSFIAGEATGLYLVTIPKYTKTPISGRLTERRPASAYALQNTGGRIERMVTPDSDELVLRTGDKKRTVYKARESDTILNYSTSPNDQYLIVTIAKSLNVEHKEYPRNPMPKSVQTEIIDMDSLKEVAKVDGFNVTWP